MGELDGRIDNTIAKAVRSIEKEIKADISMEVPTDKELITREEVIVRGEGKVGDLSMKLEKVIRRYV